MSYMTSMFIGAFAHDQETLIIRWQLSWLARVNQVPFFIYVTRILMFPRNTVIAWHIMLWTNEIWHKNILLLFVSRAYLLQRILQGAFFLDGGLRRPRSAMYLWQFVIGHGGDRRRIIPRSGGLCVLGCWCSQIGSCLAYIIYFVGHEHLPSGDLLLFQLLESKLSLNSFMVASYSSKQ
jgi:hypothetical protein